MSAPIIALFGDSLTQYGHGCERAFLGGAPGWGDRLSLYYSRRADVINRGCTQYNSRAALVTNLVPDFAAETKAKPNIVLATVWFGANDSCDGTKDFEKHVPIEEYGANLEEMYRRLSDATGRIIFITPTPVREDIYRKWKGAQVTDQNLANDRSNEVIAKYAAKCQAIAAKLNVPCLDMFSLFQSHPSVQALLSEEDGLHFTGLGDAFAFTKLIELVESKFPEMKVVPDKTTQSNTNSGSTCSSLSPLVPFWDKIDYRGYRTQLGVFQNDEEDDDDDLDSNRKITWPSRPAIVCLGDSITQQGLASPAWCQSDIDRPVYAGWGDYLAARYVRRLDVYNRGFSGYNTKWTLAAFEKIFPPSDKRAFPVELVTIFFGANDSALLNLNPTQHVPIKEFENNIEELTRRCKNEWDARRLVLIGCPPIAADKYLAWRRQKKGNEDKSPEELMDRTIDNARKYSLAVERVAKKHRIPFIDLFDVFGHNYADCLSDGLHLSPKGNQKLGDALIQTIDKHWLDMKCSPDQLRRKYGFSGSVCRAFPPEQKWFTDLYATVGSTEEQDDEEKTAPSNQKAEPKISKRMKL